MPRRCSIVWRDGTRSLIGPSDAVLVAVDATNGRAGFLAEADAGTCLTTAEIDPPVIKTLVEVNTFLKEIAPGSLRALNYRVRSGTPVGMRSSLRPTSQTERRPAVVFVYPGSEPGSTVGAMLRVKAPGKRWRSTCTSLRHRVMSLLSQARGFRRAAGRGPLDTMTLLADGVAPAVEKRLSPPGTSIPGVCTSSARALGVTRSMASGSSFMTD